MHGVYLNDGGFVKVKRQASSESRGWGKGSATRVAVGIASQGACGDLASFAEGSWSGRRLGHRLGELLCIARPRSGGPQDRQGAREDSLRLRQRSGVGPCDVPLRANTQGVTGSGALCETEARRWNRLAFGSNPVTNPSFANRDRRMTAGESNHRPLAMR